MVNKDEYFVCNFNRRSLSSGFRIRISCKQRLAIKNAKERVHLGRKKTCNLSGVGWPIRQQTTRDKNIYSYLFASKAATRKTTQGKCKHTTYMQVRKTRLYCWYNRND